jgi:hypothetical protein
MTYAFIQDVPIGRDLYAKIRKGLGEATPAGLVAHLVIEKSDGLLRYVDVWEDEAAWEAFVEQRLHPTINDIFGEMGFNPGAEPPRENVSVIDAWVPGAVLQVS